MRLPAGSAAAPLRRTLAALLLLACAALPGLPERGRAEPESDERGLSTLLDHFAASRGVEAEFREEKTLPLLQEPLVSEGLLYYAPPGRMARFTLRPEETSLLLEGDRVRIEDGLGVEEIDLSAHAQARRFIAQLLLLFAGDRKALERDYDVHFESDAGVWSLLLRPKGMAMRAVIEEIALRGQEAQLLEMVVTGTQSEVTRTTYPRMEIDRAFGDDELRQLFPAEGAPAPLPGDVRRATEADAQDAPAQ